MTCASCANRIERKLNKLDGVIATVNYATERATVTAPEAVDRDDADRHRRGRRLRRDRTAARVAASDAGGRPAPAADPSSPLCATG